MLTYLLSTLNKMSDVKPIPDHDVSPWKELGPELFDYIRMAHLHDHITLPVKHRDKKCTLGWCCVLHVFKVAEEGVRSTWLQRTRDL